jgi:hypothetical protein
MQTAITQVNKQPFPVMQSHKQQRVFGVEVAVWDYKGTTISLQAGRAGACSGRGSGGFDNMQSKASTMVLPNTHASLNVLFSVLCHRGQSEVAAKPGTCLKAS